MGEAGADLAALTDRVMCAINVVEQDTGHGTAAEQVGKSDQYLGSCWETL